MIPVLPQEMPNENYFENDINQNLGLCDNEITNAKETLADENEQQHIYENIPAKQNVEEISVSLDRDYPTDHAYFPSTITR